VAELNRLGAQCIEIPTIKIAPPEDIKPLETAIDNLDQYDWLVLTSVNGVKYFFDTLFAKGKDARALGHLKFACIGPVTKERLADHGIISDILPDTYQAESVVEAFSDLDMTGKKVLLPRAKKARTILPEQLTLMGALVDEVTAYETRLADEGKEMLIDMLEAGNIDAVTFTSSSTVTNFLTLLEGQNASALLEKVVLASIGPITSDTIRAQGLAPDIEADAFTIDGLIEALLKHYENALPGVIES
jgi:uroporphyrinogen III methyltransferase/synthase